MRNSDTPAAWAYHDSTKHSLVSVQSSRHYLDWPNRPLPFKIYTTLEPIPLTRELPPSRVPALEAIAGRVDLPAGESVPDRSALARFCYYANGVTKILKRAGGDMPFRAAASTGALYHVEVYIVCGDLPDLEAGVYQYAAHDHTLRRLRRGDFRQALMVATGGEPDVARAPAVIAFTSTFWRNAWKYQARAYRHSFWDTGTILANLFAVAQANRIPARLVLGFADDPVNRLLDVDPTQEATICLVALGRTAAEPPPAPGVELLNLPTERLSMRQVEYPAIVEMHEASSLASGAESAAWRGVGLGNGEAVSGATGEMTAAGPGVDVVPLTPAEPVVVTSIEEVIARRGSTRRFAREPIGFGELSTLLDVAARGAPSDLAVAGALADPYLIVNAVDGLPSGAYAVVGADPALQPLRVGDFRDAAGDLDLGQELAADAAVNVYALANLHAILPRLGNRGYRAAQLEAAIAGGKLYLAAYALGLGATGLTFFDDDVTRFFSPHAAGKCVMFLTAIGRPAPRRVGTRKGVGP
jgi:SagB-type dehydrogenase family enzyme